MANRSYRDNIEHMPEGFNNEGRIQASVADRKILDLRKSMPIEPYVEEGQGVRREYVDRVLHNATLLIEMTENMTQRALEKPLLRGEIYWCDWNETEFAHEFSEVHPAIVLQISDRTIDPQVTGRKRFTNCVVAPITHAESIVNVPYTLISLDNPKDIDGETITGYVDIANIRSVSRARLTRKIGTLGGETMKRVNQALAKMLDLKNANNDEKVQKQMARAEKIAAEKKILYNCMKEIRDLLNANEALKEHPEVKQIHGAIVDALKRV